MIGFIIYTLAAIALILLFTHAAWYSGGEHGITEQIAGGRPCDEEPWEWWLWVIFVLLPSGCAYIFSVSMLNEQISFSLNTSSVVEARIEDFRIVLNSKGGSRYFPEVSFETPQGQRVMAETENRFFNEPPTIGSTSKIQYDTSDPTYVLLVDGSTIRMGDAIYILILSFVGLGIGAVGIAKRARQRSVFLRGR